MKIRAADILDEDEIRQVYLEAFDDSEKESVANLASDLLNEASTPETLHLVAEVKGDLVGHIAFSPIISKSSGNLVGYLLAPLAIRPGSQKKGIGSTLVREGMERLTSHDVEMIFVYGDPNFYSRFGFSPNLAQNYLPPYVLKHPSAWQATALKESKSSPTQEAIECVQAFDKPELW